MDIWKVLNIKETKDKNLIKNAYRERLIKVNPEDDPEGFMLLRSAYEEAMKLSEKDDNIKDDSDNEIVSRIKEIYKDFSKRIDVNVWNNLFQEDCFVSLETSEEAVNTLLRFLMDNFYLPQTVWKYIIEYFDLLSRRKELLEIYPEDYIDYIFSNAKHEDLINYSLFEGEAEDIDRFIDDYYKFDLAARRRELDLEEKYINHLEDNDAYHPYIVICKVKHEIHKLNVNIENITSENFDKTLFNELLAEVKETIAIVGEDVNLMALCGEIALLVNNFDLAKEYYDRCLELAPDNYNVKGKMAELYFVEEEYEKARDTYIELLKINHYDNNARAAMIKSNSGLISQIDKKLIDDPENIKLKLDKSWSLYQSYRFEDALEVLNSFLPNEEKACEYYNVKGRSYLCTERYDEALICFEKWKDIILGLPEDDISEETNKKRVRINYVNFLIADCYLKTKKYDKAKKYLNIAIAKEHEEIELAYEAYCELYFETQDYEECIKKCEELLSREDRNYVAYLFMAKSYFHIGYYKEMLNYSEMAIGIYPYMPDPYIYQIRLFLLFSQYDNALAVINRFENIGIESDKIDYWKAEIKNSNKDYEEALEIADNIISRHNDGFVSDVEDFSDVFVLKADILFKLDKTDEALWCYNEAININSKNIYAHGKKGVLLRMNKKFDEAIEELSIMLNKEKHPYYFVNRGIIFKELGKTNEAISDFENAILLENNNMYAIVNLAYLYKQNDQFDKALYNYNKAISILDSNIEYKNIVYINRARVLQKLNCLDESKKQYDDFIEEMGLNPQIAYEYSELLYRMGNTEDTISLLNKVISEFDYSREVGKCIQKLCYIYGIEGFLDKANECFSLGISNEPNDCTYYGVMGEVFLQFNLFEEARKMFERAAELDRDNRYNYFADAADATARKKGLFNFVVTKYLSKIKKRLNYCEDSSDYINDAKAKRASKDKLRTIATLVKALDTKMCNECLYCKCHEAYYELGVTYEQMNDMDKALRCYKRALAICGHNALYERCIKRIEKNDSRN